MNSAIPELGPRGEYRPAPLGRLDVYILTPLAVLAVVSTLPFFYAAAGSMPAAHDLSVHWIRMIAFDEVLRSGVWYPRWLDSMNFGYGAATTAFYAPGVYYALSASHALTGNWAGAIQALVVFAATASSAAFYGYVRLWVAPRAAIVGAALYLILPYRLIDLYHRAALAELLAFLWIPLLMTGFTLAVRNKGSAALAGSAIALALLVVTHPPTAYLFAMSLVVFALASGLTTRRWRPVACAAVILAIGGALSAFYSIPAVTELSLVKQPITSEFEMRPGNMAELISGGQFERMIAAIALATFLLILSFYAAVRRPLGRRNEVGGQLLAWVIVSVFAMVMMMPLAAPVVRSIPGLSGVGYLWRWLAVQLFAAATVAALAFDRLAVARVWRVRLVALAAMTALVLGFGFVASFAASNLRRRFVPPSDATEEAFTPRAAAPIELLPRDAPLVLADCAGGDAQIVDWRPGRRVITVSSPRGCKLEIRTFAYPGWHAAVDGRGATIEAEPNRGTLLVDSPGGDHTLTLQFNDTPVRVMARWVSGGALLASMIFLAIPMIRRAARWGTRR